MGEAAYPNLGQAFRAQAAAGSEAGGEHIDRQHAPNMPLKCSQHAPNMPLTCP